MPPCAYDPLAAARADDAPPFDVLLSGTVFLDMIFAGMPTPAEPGTEVWAEGLASCPGGIANLAVATRRLGLRTALAAAFGDDDYADFCWRTLAEQEQVDLSRSRQFAEWHSPVTVSMSVGRDRSMVTHAHRPPIGRDELVGAPPASRAVLVDLTDIEAARDGAAPGGWVAAARAAGAQVFADVGWDATQTWDPAALEVLPGCHAFMPNAGEAMAYTRTDTPQEALYDLADRVPLAVVTLGAEGAIAIDNETGEEANVPALQVPALDPTGAGDVFSAAMVVGTLAGWPLQERLSLGALCSALSLQQFGGSLAAPGWGDVTDWWHHLVAQDRDDAYHRSLRRRFAFLADIAPLVPPGACRRASATIARRSDVHDLL